MHHPKRPLLIRAPPACYPAYPLRWAVHNAVCPLASVINHRSSGSRPVCPETARHHCAAATGSWGPMTLDGGCRFCLASRLEYQSLGLLRCHTVRATCSWPPERTKKTRSWRLHLRLLVVFLLASFVHIETGKAEVSPIICIVVSWVQIRKYDGKAYMNDAYLHRGC